MNAAGQTLTDELRSSGLHIPNGYELTTLAERPDRRDAVEQFGSSVWPEFMLKDEVSDRYWSRMADERPEYQLLLIGAAGMALPQSGRYVVPGARAPVEIDHENGLGTYFDPNVWVIHDLD